MARSTTDVKSAPVRLVPSVSSFDFLEGAFAASQRARKFGLIVTLVAVAVLTVLVLAGLSGLLDKRTRTQQLADTQAANSVAVAKLAKIDNANGISADQLASHVRERRTALKDGIGKEIDVVALTRALRASAPAGVEITSIVFHDATGAVTNAAPVAGQPATPATPAPAPGAGTTGAAGTAGTAGTGSDQVGSVEIKATMKSFALLGAWGNSVKKIQGLVPGDPMWQSSGGQVSASLNLPVTRDGLTARAQELTSGKVK